MLTINPEPSGVEFVIASDPASVLSAKPARPKQTRPAFTAHVFDCVATIQTVSVVPDPVVEPVREELPLSKIARSPFIAFVVNVGVPKALVVLDTFNDLSLQADTGELPVTADISFASNQS